MPTYEYACTECGDRSEVVQRFSDEPLTVCSACGGKLRKVFSPVGIVFKGSGFYRTDSRSGSVTAGAANGNGGKDGASTSGSSDTSSSGTSDSKASDGKSSDSKPKADTGSSSGTAKSDAGSKVA